MELQPSWFSPIGVFQNITKNTFSVLLYRERFPWITSDTKNMCRTIFYLMGQRKFSLKLVLWNGSLTKITGSAGMSHNMNSLLSKHLMIYEHTQHFTTSTNKCSSTWSSAWKPVLVQRRTPHGKLMNQQLEKLYLYVIKAFFGVNA